MEFDFDATTNLSGSLLIAHPSMLDRHFHKTVVLVSSHTLAKGSLGVIINRPTGKTLGEHNDDFAFSPLSDVLLYQGGPVNSDEMLFVAWLWSDSGDTFKLHFGITPEKAEELLREDPSIEIRGFLGYAGWSEGQLEAELGQGAWLVTQVAREVMEEFCGAELWHQILLKAEPDLSFLANVPKDPSRN